MTTFFCRSTQRIYDIDNFESLLMLRNDLKSVGFFELNDNLKYYPLFARKIKTGEFIEIFNNIKLFDTSRIPFVYKKNLIT